MTALTSGNTLVGDDWDISPEKESDRPESAKETTMDRGEMLADILRRFHRNSCYPDALPGEIKIVVDQINSTLQSCSQAGKNTELILVDDPSA